MDFWSAWRTATIFHVWYVWAQVDWDEINGSQDKKSHGQTHTLTPLWKQVCESKGGVKTCICKGVMNSRDKSENPLLALGDERLFTLIDKKKKCVGLLNIFSSVFWKHLHTSKRSQPIDAVLIFTSPKWGFRIPTQRAERDPREPARHDSTAVYLIAWSKDDLCPLTGPGGTGVFSETLPLESALEATWTPISHTHTYKHTAWQDIPPAEATLHLEKFVSKQLLVNGKRLKWLNLCWFVIGGPSSLRRTSIPLPLPTRIHRSERVEKDSV